MSLKKESVKQSALTCIIGYVLIIISALILSIIVRILTGYFPSLTFFTLALITFRLSEVSHAFLLAPLFMALIVMLLLSRTLIDTRIAGGLSLSSYYVLIEFVFIIMRSGDFPYLVLIPWLVFVFFLGFISSVIIEKIKL